MCLMKEVTYTDCGHIEQEFISFCQHYIDTGQRCRAERLKISEDDGEWCGGLCGGCDSDRPYSSLKERTHKAKASRTAAAALSAVDKKQEEQSEDCMKFNLTEDFCAGDENEGVEEELPSSYLRRRPQNELASGVPWHDGKEDRDEGKAKEAAAQSGQYPGRRGGEAGGSASGSGFFSEEDEKGMYESWVPGASRKAEEEKEERRWKA